MIRRQNIQPGSQIRRLFKRRSEGGQGIVEFALGVPFMLLILLGTIDMGRMFFEYIDLRGAVREGVTAAARSDCATANSVAETAVLAHSEDLNDGGTIVSPVTYSPSCPTSYDDPTTTVSLTANRSFQPIFTEFLDIYFGLGGAINMEATASAKVWT